MTEIVKDGIEYLYGEIEKQKRLKIVKELAGSSDGYYGDLTIQEIKANKNI